MEEVVSVADASRRFFEILRAVESGASIVVTSGGRPVARIVPVADDDRTRLQARAALFARLQEQRPRRAVRWTRNELYDEAP